MICCGEREGRLSAAGGPGQKLATLSGQRALPSTTSIAATRPGPRAAGLDLRFGRTTAFHRAAAATALIEPEIQRVGPDSGSTLRLLQGCLVKLLVTWYLLLVQVPAICIGGTGKLFHICADGSSAGR